jgi:hypothetical protein
MKDHLVVFIRSVIVAESQGGFMNVVRAHRPQRAKTSIDILRERDELNSRVTILEAVLDAIGKETRQALTHPQIALTTLCRIEALVRQAEVEPDVQPPPISQLRPLQRA